MKLKIAIIMCAIVCALLVVSQWSPSEKMSRSAQSSSGKAKTNGENGKVAAMPGPKALADLQPAQQNQAQPSEQPPIKDTIKQGFGDGAVKAKDAMEEFLKTWNPIGRSAQELKATFGKPSEEKANSITYMFDTGAFGWVFEFVLQNGKVVELKRPASE